MPNKKISPKQYKNIVNNPNPKYKATKILKEIERLKYQLNAHQEMCKHPYKHRYVWPKGSYDPSGDTYWDENYCALCQKIWATSQVYRPGVVEVTKYT